MKAIRITGVLAALALLAGCSNMLSNNPNTAPTAVVSPGSIAYLYPGESVDLNGRDSADDDQQDLSYLWTMESGSNGALSGAATAMPTYSTDFLASSEGTHIVRLTVSDEYDITDTADVTIEVMNRSPVPEVTPALTTAVADTALLTFDGANTDNDPDRSAVCSYAWSISDRPDASSNTLSDTGDMTAVVGDLTSGNEEGAGPVNLTLDGNIGVYEISLTCTDELGDTGTGTAIVVTTGNNPPSAIPGVTGEISGSGTFASPYIIAMNTNISIDLASTDAQSDTLDYIWTVNNFTFTTATTIPMAIDNGAVSTRSSGAEIKVEETPVNGYAVRDDDLIFSVSTTGDIQSGDKFSVTADITDGDPATSVQADIYFEID